MLSSTHELADSRLVAVREAVSTSSFEQMNLTVFRRLSFLISATAADNVFLQLFPLFKTPDSASSCEVSLNSRCKKELCFLLHFWHDHDVHNLAE